TYTARVDLCATFSTLPPGTYSADLTSASFATNNCTPGVDPDCLAFPIRTGGDTTPQFSFVVVANGDRFGDNCPETPPDVGGAADTGCPNALRAQVTSTGVPFDGAVVRVFNRNDAAYQEVQGKNAHETPPTLAMILFERNAGAVGACITGKQTVQSDPA